MAKTLDEIDELTLEGTGEGSESEEDLGKVDPSLVNKAVVTGTDWTADTILKQLEKGNIVLDPVFQRRDAWNDKRKSKFIESIILGLPIPQIVLAESQETKGTFVVIDGKQRLLTLQRFAGIRLEADDEPLKLSGLTVRDDLNGKTLTDLQNDAHDGTVAMADQWLQHNIAPLLSSSYFKPGGNAVMFITFDNGDGDAQGQVFTAVIGNSVIPGVKVSASFRHENTLRTIMGLLGLKNFPGASANAAPMSELFR